MNRRSQKAYFQQDSYAPPSDGLQFSAEVIQKAEERDIPVEKDPTVFRETADIDLGAQVPPQVYAVVAGVMDLIRKLEEEEGTHAR